MFKSSFASMWKDDKENVKQTTADDYPEENFGMSLNQVLTMNINGFNKEAVKLVLGHMVGFKGGVDCCADFDVLFNMLEFCDSYEISDAVREISKRFKSFPVIKSLSDFVDAFELAEELEEVKRLEFVQKIHPCNALFKRCVTLARSNFMSWQVMVDFIKENGTENDFVLKLFKRLEKNSAVIRLVDLHCFSCQFCFHFPF